MKNVPPIPEHKLVVDGGRKLPEPPPEEEKQVIIFVLFVCFVISRAWEIRNAFPNE